MDISYVDAFVLGVVEGLTEFLPVSSTGHLTIAEKLLGMQIDDPGVTAYTALIQVPAILATFIYFRTKIAALFMAWVRGLARKEARGEQQYTMAWAVILGSIPVAVVGLLLQDLITGDARSLWVVAVALVLWSGVMWLAERRHDQLAAAGKVRDEKDVTIKDGVILGLAQCFSLIPGVSRSGTTISMGLFQGLNRVVATELAFFLAIPALTAAGIYETVKSFDDLRGLGTGPIILGMVVSFVVAYGTIAWLLKFVANNSLRSFINYRIVLGLVLLVALSAGWLSAT